MSYASSSSPAASRASGGNRNTITLLVDYLSSALIALVWLLLVSKSVCGREAFSGDQYQAAFVHQGPLSYHQFQRHKTISDFRCSYSRQAFSKYFVCFRFINMKHLFGIERQETRKEKQSCAIFLIYAWWYNSWLPTQKENISDWSTWEKVLISELRDERREETR